MHYWLKCLKYKKKKYPKTRAGLVPSDYEILCLAQIHRSNKASSRNGGYNWSRFKSPELRLTQNILVPRIYFLVVSSSLQNEGLLLEAGLEVNYLGFQMYSMLYITLN